MTAPSTKARSFHLYFGVCWEPGDAEICLKARFPSLPSEQKLDKHSAEEMQGWQSTWTTLSKETRSPGSAKAPPESVREIGAQMKRDAVTRNLSSQLFIVFSFGRVFSFVSV